MKKHTQNRGGRIARNDLCLAKFERRKPEEGSTLALYEPTPALTKAMSRASESTSLQTSRQAETEQSKVNRNHVQTYEAGTFEELG